MDIGDQRLFSLFLAKGFTGLVNDEPEKLGTYLEQRAEETGSAAYAFLAQAILEAYGLFLEHDEAGGIRIGFMRQLDQLVFGLRAAEDGDPKEAAHLTRAFRTEIRKRITLYDPQKEYEE